MKLSPNSNSLSCAASSAGRTRKEARPTQTENFSPSAKRGASTAPLRWEAAKSDRAGVSLASRICRAITFFQQGIQGPRTVGLAADRPAGPGAIDPGGDIQVRPAFRLADKAVEKQRGGDRAGIIVGGVVVQVRHP